MNDNGRLSFNQEPKPAVAAAAPGQDVGANFNLPLILWQRRWIVLLGTLVCLVGGFIHLTRLTPMYRSTARLYVEKTGPRIVHRVEGFMSESRNYLYTQAELIKSTPILSAAVEEPDVGKLRTFTGLRNPIGKLKSALSINIGARDSIINLSVASAYPKDAALLANVVMDAYIFHYAKMKRSTALEVLRLLQRQKDKVDEEFETKLNAMLDFKKRNGALAFHEGGGNVVFQRLAAFSEALTEAQLTTVEARSGYEMVKLVKDDPQQLSLYVAGAAIAPMGVFISLNNEEARLRAEMNQSKVLARELKREYAPDAVAIRILNDRIEGLEQQITDHAQAHVELVRQQLLAAMAREKEIESFVGEQQKLAENLNVRVAEYALLQTDLDRTERMASIIDDRIKELNVNEEAGALNITVLEHAKPAGRPFEPKKSKILAQALIAGMVLGVGLALMRDRMDQRLRSAEEITALLETPVLGVVPQISSELDPAERGKLAYDDSKSHIAEAYRTIRTAVYFGVPEGKAKSLLVTSAGAGEGKSTLSSNLAITIAQAGQRVLLLDADFRKPRQHEIYQVPHEAGLANVLAGRAKLEEVIQQTDVEHLDILPCGPIPPNPSEMLNSQIFADTLEELAKTYDHIVIDSPPVMPVADARILGAMCDVVILVLLAERTTRKAAQQAREGLLSVGANILGTVVNGVHHRRGRYGYYGGYYSSYGYYGYGQGQDGGRRRRRVKQEAEAVSSEQ